MSRMIRPPPVSLRNKDNRQDVSALFWQLGHMVVSLVLYIANDAHGCICTTAQHDTALPWSEQKDTEILNLRE